MRSIKAVGIDGCRAGWIAFLFNGTVKQLWEAKVYETIDALWEELSEVDLLLIDMPIGLPAHQAPVRLCDVEARKLLRPTRASSIFPAPIRDLLAVQEYPEANALSKKLASRGLSKQTWNLMPKIRELDLLLQANIAARLKLRESHPELIFASLNGGIPLTHNKKTQAGYEQRLQLLLKWCPEAHTLVEQALIQFQRKAAARDDIVDALVLAISARWGANEVGVLEKLPTIQQYDATGLPMEIYFPKIK
ncbi:DUF429 domain-containing protein [Paenibacillus agricola]|uniref:DUF429 domain-containing protein n=1 Tax=Paenibacillus agricola TaxID=2716264 RepID=A0ABX0J4F7_9BACL|nr:DUF429 domain-containing protein [Paenibacillus agricola]NHN30004.1 DUF429 domain-containing protein [Paenibacillus agricola]